MEEELKDIKVGKIPNGYFLHFDGNKYMYYTLKDLLEGFMYHVGLGELGYTDNETIQEFITAAIVWSADDGKTAQEIVSLQKENEALRGTCANYQKRIKQLHKRLKSGGKKGGRRSQSAPDDDDDIDDDE